VEPSWAVDWAGLESFARRQKIPPEMLPILFSDAVASVLSVDHINFIHFALLQTLCAIINFKGPDKMEIQLSTYRYINL
jgi:hypothetical protein